MAADARANQVGKLLGRQAQLIHLHAKKIANALEVEGRWSALPAEVFIELGAIDGEFAANLGD